MPIYSNFYQTLTTACPIVELRGYAAACGLKGHLYAYLDFNGPTGTARDGLAEGMLALAIEKKQLAPGQPIIEAASGPFATALTLASLTAGHPIVIAMPEDAPVTIAIFISGSPFSCDYFRLCTCCGWVHRSGTALPAAVWPGRERLQRRPPPRTAGTI